MHRQRELRAGALGAVLVALGGCGDGPPAGETAPDDATILLEYEADTPDLEAQHHAWHLATSRSSPSYGLEFLRFHRTLIGTYDTWRATHGYAPLAPWDPGTPIPHDAPHPGRLSENPSAVDPLCRRPVWLTVAGGSRGERDPDFGAANLASFTSSNQLGRSIDSATSPNWHGRVHATVGGDFESATRLVHDPIFWRWHKFIDDIWATYQAEVPGAPDQ
jgi:hypothetical protein